MNIIQTNLNEISDVQEIRNKKIHLNTHTHTRVSLIYIRVMHISIDIGVLINHFTAKPDVGKCAAQVTLPRSFCGELQRIIAIWLRQNSSRMMAENVAWIIRMFLGRNQSESQRMWFR